METNHRPLVLFHGGCPDGVASAWILWRRHFDRADYLGVAYDQPPPDCTDRLVYILDFSYPPDVLEKMADQATRIVCIDHHETAISRYGIEGWQERHDVELHFDIRYSGAQLTASYFGAQTRMWIIDYVGDRDLWKWQLPDSREVNAAIGSTIAGLEPLDAFKALEDLRALSMKNVVSMGRGALLHIDACVREIVRTAKRCEFFGHRNVPVVNLAYPMTSEVLNKLAVGAPFAVGVRIGSRIHLSLRAADSGVNVAKVAETFGGGGHAKAAGFSLALEQAPILEDWFGGAYAARQEASP